MAIRTFHQDLASTDDKNMNNDGPAIQLLITALDRVEAKDGYWHSSISNIILSMNQLDDRQSGLYGSHPEPCGSTEEARSGA